MNKYIISLILLSQILNSSQNFNINAVVVGNCYIKSSTDLSFGIYNPTSLTDTFGTMKINIVCASKTKYKLYLGDGLSGDHLDRIMYNGVHELHYNIYKRPNQNKIWGGSRRKASRKKNKILTGYGVIPKGQSVPSGIYSDTIIATITY